MLLTVKYLITNTSIKLRKITCIYIFSYYNINI